MYKPHKEAFALKPYLTADIKEDVDNLRDDATEMWKRLWVGSVSMIEERLPEQIQKEWIKIVTGEKRSEISKNKFPALLKLLSQFKVEPKSEAPSRWICQEIRPRSPTTQWWQSWCWIHPNSTEHPIWRCKSFESKSPADRVDLVRKRKACFSCLFQGHTSTFCNRNFKFKEEGCNMHNYQLLHEARASGIAYPSAGISFYSYSYSSSVKPSSLIATCMSYLTA